jgi:hypothetical protein
VCEIDERPQFIWFLCIEPASVRLQKGDPSVKRFGKRFDWQGACLENAAHLGNAVIYEAPFQDDAADKTT